MNTVKRMLITSALLTASITPSVSAGVETSFTYNGLYKSIKTASAAQYSQLSLNFYLLKKASNQVCPIESSFLSDGENKLDLLVKANGQMLLPLDKNLKKDHAAITIPPPEKDMCNLRMKIEVASFELENTTVSSVTSWQSQMQALFADLAGWPGRYFMPDVIGLNFNFAASGQHEVYLMDQGQRTLLKRTQSQLIFISTTELERLNQDANLVFSTPLLSVTQQLEH